MAVSHHPSEATQLSYAMTELGAGAALLVACHIEQCVHCAGALGARQGHGFIADDAQAPGRPKPVVSDREPARPAVADQTLPRAMDGFRRGRWRWTGPGVRSAMLQRAAGLGERIYLLKARPGARLARHGHPGSEWVLVLKGAFADGAVRYEVGDVSEHHKTHTHSLTVSAEGECLCLVVTDRRLRFFGLARLLQPFLKL